MRSPSGIAVGRMRGAGAHRDRRGCRPRCGRSRCRPCARSTTMMRVRAVEPPVALHDVRTPASMSVRRACPRTAGAARPSSRLLTAREVDRDLGLAAACRPGPCAKNCTPRSAASPMAFGGLGGRDERLRGHHVGEHRRAADAGPLDERDLGSELGAGEGRLVAAGSASEDRRSVACARTRRPCSHSLVSACRAQPTSTRLRTRAPALVRVVGCQTTPQPARRPRRPTLRDRRRRRRADIAELTGVERHDIALTLGSGWGKAAELIGETTAHDPRDRDHRLQRARARGPRRHAAQRPAAERQARARDRRAHPLLRGPRRAPGRALACAPRPRRARRR